MTWFDDKHTNYKVTSTAKGWFGPRTVSRTVIGRHAAEREMARMRRRGAVNVRRTAGGWWVTR